MAVDRSQPLGGGDGGDRAGGGARAPPLSLSLSLEREKTLCPERRTKRKVRAKGERERARRKDASVVRVAFFARNLLLSRLLFGPDRNSAKCID